MYSLIDVQMFEEFISEELGDDVEVTMFLFKCINVKFV